MRIDFNKHWNFYHDGKVKEDVTLPFDAMLLEKRYATAPSGKDGAYFKGNAYRFTRKLVIEEKELMDFYELFFEGVYRYAKVSLNGELLKENTDGFAEFSVSLTGHLVAGENEIEVLADNSLVPSARWYTGAGILRPVTLIHKKTYHLSYLHVRTLSIKPMEIEVDAGTECEISIEDGNTCLYHGPSGKIALPDAILWSPENPKRYHLTALYEDEKEETYFGIRSIQLQSGKGLLINGKEVLLKGACIHSDDGILGTASFKEIEFRKVKALKKAGFNAIRCAHNPCSRELLEACDELGMCVIDEAFDGWYTPKVYHDYAHDFFSFYKSSLKSMTEKDYNHPSVIMYSLGNEVSETASEKGRKLLKEMNDLVHEYDSSRPITCGINLLIDVYDSMGMGIYKEKGTYKKEPLPDKKKGQKEQLSGSSFFNYWIQKLGGLMLSISKGRRAGKIAETIAPCVDVLGYNYGSSRYEMDSKKHPDWFLLGTETMVCHLPYNWKRVEKIPNLLGDFVWAGIDYLGEVLVGDYVYLSYPGLGLTAGSGVLNLSCSPTCEAAYMQIVRGERKEPFISVPPLNHHGETPLKSAWRIDDGTDSWNYTPYKGTKTSVTVYALGKEAELIINGKSLGRKKLKDYKAVFACTYVPGSAEAVCYDGNGKKISSSLQVTGKESHLAVTLNKETYAPYEIAAASISFQDENGSVIPYLEKEIRLEVKKGTLLAFGSAATKTNELFGENTHTSFRGRALAYVRADNDGQVVLFCSSEGYLNALAETKSSHTDENYTHSSK